MAETEEKVTTTPQDTSREGSISAGQQTPQAVEKSETKNEFVDYFTQDVRTTLFVELQLLLITFCTGIQGKKTPILTFHVYVQRLKQYFSKMQQHFRTITVLPRIKLATPYSSA